MDVFFALVHDGYAGGHSPWKVGVRVAIHNRTNQFCDLVSER